jgi:hypothetical protein
MAREPDRPPGGFVTVNIYQFAQPALAALQGTIHAKGMPRPSRDDVASAMVWVAAQLPPEVSKAMVEAYISAEKDAHDAVASALTAFFRR